ncbi:MAG: secretin [Alteromonadaceae bacterium]|nr:secretin [Alteromonadaceae bacterium]
MINPLATNHPLARFVFCAFLCLALVSGPAFGQSESRIYELNNRTAESMAAQIRPLYQGEPVTMTTRGNQLVVRAQPRLLDEIGTLIESMDVAPVQMRITVRYRQDIGGKQTGGNVSLNNGQAGIGATSRTISTASSSQRQLMVQSGQSAHITSGQVRTLPVAVQGGRNPAAVFQQIETQSGFVVTPRAISERNVELTIVSFEEDPAELEGYETEALMTRRQVEPGQWVELGGTRTTIDQQRQGIGYRVTGNERDNRMVEVKVELLP